MEFQVYEGYATPKARRMAVIAFRNVMRIFKDPEKAIKVYIQCLSDFAREM